VGLHPGREVYPEAERLGKSWWGNPNEYNSLLNSQITGYYYLGDEWWG